MQAVFLLICFLWLPISLGSNNVWNYNHLYLIWRQQPLADNETMGPCAVTLHLFVAILFVFVVILHLFLLTLCFFLAALELMVVILGVFVVVLKHFVLSLSLSFYSCFFFLLSFYI